MAKVTLTSNLKKYYPESEFEMEGKTLKEVLKKMDEVRPHFTSYILEDNEHIRQHVNIFIDGQMLQDKTNINISIQSTTQVHIMQALSGG